MQPQTLGVPPPLQVWGAVQEPQVTVRETPQLSLLVTGPQFFPRRVQNWALVSGAQPQTLGVPPPPQVWGAVQEPQFTVRETPQLSLAVTGPQFFPRRVQNRALVSGTQLGAQNEPFQ